MQLAEVKVTPELIGRPPEIWKLIEVVEELSELGRATETVVETLAD